MRIKLFIFLALDLLISAHKFEKTLHQCPQYQDCQNVFDCSDRVIKIFRMFHLNATPKTIFKRVFDYSRCPKGVCCPFARFVNLTRPTMMPIAEMRMNNTTTTAVPTTQTVTITETTSVTTPAVSTTVLTTVTTMTPVTTSVTPDTTTVTQTTTQQVTMTTRKVYENILDHPHFDVLAGFHCGFGGYSRISRGIRVDPGDLPWTVILRYTYAESGLTVSRCGGALISNRYVLTAAHCIVLKKEEMLALTSVVLGETNLESKKDCYVNKTEESDLLDGDRIVFETCADAPQEIMIAETFPHPNFRLNSLLSGFPDDIGLIRLSQRVTFTTYIKPICVAGLQNLKDPKFMNINTDDLTVAGWGMTELSEDPRSNELLRADVKRIPRETCDKLHRMTTHECQLCAGGINGSACQGDSGGPLTTQAMNRDSQEICPLLVGIVSYGYHICEHESPTVFSNVSCYLNWILDTVKIEDCESDFCRSNDIDVSSNFF